MKHAHVFLDGRVQGVGFRYFTRKNAQKLGVNGWVKNLNDGRVEAVFEGPANRVDKMLDAVKQGPPSSHVRDMDVDYKEEQKGYSGFNVRYA